ncbi:hypothetical protein [Streptomyces sp. NPDC003480]
MVEQPVDFGPSNDGADRPLGERADDLSAQLVPLDQPGIVGEHQVMLNHGVTEGRWARRCW